MAGSSSFCTAVAVFGLAPLLWAQGGGDVLAQVDRYRYPWPAFSVDVELRDGKTRQQWRVLVRENGDARVEGLSDKERGRTVLLLQEEMWLLLPKAKRPVKVSPQQRLLGPAAGGDIARFRFSGDYTLAGEQKETLDGNPVRRMDLQATRKTISYRTAVLWTTLEGLPLKADFHFASGKRARTAHFGEIVTERGARVLSSLRLEEPPDRTVDLLFTHWKPATPDDALFTLPPAP